MDWECFDFVEDDKNDSSSIPHCQKKKSNLMLCKQFKREYDICFDDNSIYINVVRTEWSAEETFSVFHIAEKLIQRRIRNLTFFPLENKDAQRDSKKSFLNWSGSY